MDHLIDSVYRINRNLHRYRKRKERERERTERQKCAKYTGARDTCENVCGETQQGRDEGERGLRGPHGVVKSIRPGLEPRLPALLTVVRRERHQPRRRPGRCHGGRGRGGRGPRIKYHPRYVPFENVPSLSIPLSLSLSSHSLAGSHLRLPDARPGESARLSFKFSIFDLFDAEIAKSNPAKLSKGRVRDVILRFSRDSVSLSNSIRRVSLETQKERIDTFSFLPRNSLRALDHDSEIVVERKINGKST